MNKKDIEKIEKLTKRREKLQADIDKIKENLAKKEREKIANEKRFYKTKSLEEIKEREIELKEKKEKDQAIIQDENAFPLTEKPQRVR